MNMHGGTRLTRVLGAAVTTALSVSAVMATATSASADDSVTTSHGRSCRSFYSALSGGGGWTSGTICWDTRNGDNASLEGRVTNKRSSVYTGCSYARIYTEERLESGLVLRDTYPKLRSDYACGNNSSFSYGFGPTKRITGIWVKFCKGNRCDSYH
ncbi:hypothetical protein ACFXDE_03870 [Kitasatospora sp. NPDC059408]|uniref:hypothetical protein n=1 Tax=Kitasatospora sp. NPDC059408 TaxID=3346823 RepID=UPI003677E734